MKQSLRPQSPKGRSSTEKFWRLCAPAWQARRSGSGGATTRQLELSDVLAEGGPGMGAGSRGRGVDLLLQRTGPQGRGVRPGACGRNRPPVLQAACPIPHSPALLMEGTCEPPCPARCSSVRLRRTRSIGGEASLACQPPPADWPAPLRQLAPTPSSLGVEADGTVRLHKAGCPAPETAAGLAAVLRSSVASTHLPRPRARLAPGRHPLGALR